jgi:hypothetical protein
LYDMRKRPTEQRKFPLDGEQVGMTADQKEKEEEENGEKAQVRKIRPNL